MINLDNNLPFLYQKPNYQELHLCLTDCFTWSLGCSGYPETISFHYAWKTWKIWKKYEKSLANTRGIFHVFLKLLDSISPRHLLLVSEAVSQSSSVKKVFQKISQNLQENTYTRVSFLIKLQPSAFRPDSGTGVFRWILRNF